MKRLLPITGLPVSLTVDHGTEFMSKALEALGVLSRRSARLHARPGKPTDNSHIESFNGRLRDECLNVHQFLSLAHAQTVMEAWRRDYDEVRPHSSLGDLTPAEFILKRQIGQTEKARLL